jgi:hypothetical protein
MENMKELEAAVFVTEVARKAALGDMDHARKLFNEAESKWLLADREATRAATRLEYAAKCGRE